MLAIILITVGILLRLAPHAPNFTPVAAIALFGGAYLKKRYALIVPLALMIVSDMFIGMHDIFLFTWAGFILTAILGFWVRKQNNVTRIACASLLSSLAFFVISNFGVWVMGWYPRTLSGLINCYIMAIPFLRDFTISTMLYTAVFFGSYEFIANSVKDTKVAKVLLKD